MKNLLFSMIFALSVVVFGACQSDFNPQIISAELIDVVPTEHSQNNEMSKWLAPYKTTLDKFMGVEIGVAAKELMHKENVAESLLGNFILEVMKDYAKNHRQKFDFTITNKGGLRGSLPCGTLTIGDVYSVFPFDNELVILTLSGKKVEQLCREIANKDGEITDGIKMLIFENEKIEEIYINGSKLDTLRNYKVLTTDYLSFGSDKLFALADYSEMYCFKAPLREVIINYIENENKKGKKIDAKLKNETIIFTDDLIPTHRIQCVQICIDTEDF